MRVEASLRELAELGDAIINFVASAALTMREGRPRGVRVPDKLLRRAAARSGLGGWLDYGPEDLFEAAAAYAWLANRVTLERMVRVVLEGMGSEGLEGGLAALAGLLRDCYRELIERAGGLRPGA